MIPQTRPQIRIDPALKALWPEARLGCLTWRALPSPEHPALWTFFTREILPGLGKTLQDTPLAELPNLGESRRAYKAFGRDPGRTRVSSEALYRRIRQGKELYRINSVVDASNLVSLETGFSLGSYDLARLEGGLLFRLGEAGEMYAGIGKDGIDLARLPLLADARGPFGSPSSDSQRAMISLESRDILTVIYGFSGQQELEAALALARKRLADFAEAGNCAVFTVC